MAVRTLLFPLELLSNGIGKIEKALKPEPTPANDSFFNLDNKLKIAQALLDKEEKILDDMKARQKAKLGTTPEFVDMSYFYEDNSFEKSIAKQERKIERYKASRDTQQKILDQHGKELDLSAELKKAKLELAAQQEILKVKKAREAAAKAPTEYSEQHFANDDKAIAKAEAEVERQETIVSRYSVAVDNLTAASNLQGGRSVKQPPPRTIRRLYKRRKTLSKSRSSV